MSAPVMPQTFQVRLVDTRLVTERVKQLTFERVDGQPFTFLAGQWVSVVFPLKDARDRPLRRSYSIASIPDGSSRFELIVTRVDGGAGSTFLHEAAVGAEFEVKGPQGMFTRPLETAGPSLFVCTGTGVAPFRGMIHEALRAGQTHPLVLLFGVRTPSDFIYGAELQALARQHPQFTIHVSLSKPSPDWIGLTGYVQTHVAALWKSLEGASPAHAYICGVKKMLMASRDILKNDFGVERQRVHVESYD